MNDIEIGDKVKFVKVLSKIKTKVPLGEVGIVTDLDENGEYFTKLFSKEQTYKSMLKILGY